MEYLPQILDYISSRTESFLVPLWEVLYPVSHRTFCSLSIDFFSFQQRFLIINNIFRNFITDK